MVSGLCSVHETEKDNYKKLWYETMKEKGYLEDVGINGRVIIKCILK
jgi:hypothetical protein